MQLFAKIVRGFRRLTMFVKCSILDIGQGSEYDSAADSNSLLVLSKNETADLFAN